MDNIFVGAGWFLIPLGLCSLFGLYVIVERLLALQTHKVLPSALIGAFLAGRLDQAQADSRSSAGRIVAFCRTSKPDPEALKAFSLLEIARLERGLFLLDIVVAGAPLLGLLGTVTGLIKVFGGIDMQGTPDSAVFTQGIALALSTTMLGLIIAIPALVASGYLYRRVDMFAVQLNLGVERLIDLHLAAESHSVAAASVGAAAAPSAGSASNSTGFSG